MKRTKTHGPRRGGSANSRLPPANLRWARAVVLAVAALGVGGSARSMVFPGADWQEATPGSQGVDSAKLQAAMDYLAANCGSAGTTQAIVIRDGYMIWKGSDIDNTHNIWSCSKSFTSTVLGLLIEDGRCTLDTLAKDHVSGLTSDYPAVKLRHFATMASGYDAVGGNQSATPFDPTTPLFAPGTEFQYWDSAMNQFANVLTRIAGEPIENLFKRRIADPIGMNSAKWDWGDWGTVGGYVVNGGAGNKSKGIHVSAREMARFGHLFLNRGNWDGTQRISASWVDQARSVQVAATVPAHTAGSNGPGTYGFNWWINGIKPDSTRKWPGAPNSTYAASGFNNNKCFVVPEWNMVVVRLGTDGDVGDGTYSTFFVKLAQALTGNAAPTASIGSPADDATFAPGDRMDYSGGATDPEDGTLSGGALAWEVDIVGDGLGPVHTSTGASGSYTFPGDITATTTYRLRLTATDSGGLSHTAEITVYAEPQTSNRPPSVSLTASPTSGEVPLAVSFDAGSSDPDGDALTHEWDFDYDGSTFTVDQITGATATTSHEYGAAGDYTAAVRVSDGQGLSRMATVSITVSQPSSTQIVIECEDMTLADYLDEGDGYIAVDYNNVTSGTATASFPGATGRYRVEVVIVKEDDGQPTLDVYVAGALVGTIDYQLGAANRDPETVDLGELDITSGAEIQLVGTMDASAAARVDKIIFTPVGSSSDSDGDDLPDSWELGYFGDVTSQGKDDDYDGDGYSNYQEYLAGTDPTNADDRPASGGGGRAGCAPNAGILPEEEKGTAAAAWLVALASTTVVFGLRRRRTDEKVLRASGPWAYYHNWW